MNIAEVIIYLHRLCNPNKPGKGPRIKADKTDSAHGSPSEQKATSHDADDDTHYPLVRL